MKEKKLFGISLDVLGFSGSFLCAVHCLAIPVLVSFGALSHFHLHITFAWEWVLFMLLLAIAIASLYGSYRHNHRDPRPLVVAAVSVLLITIGEFYHHGAGHLISGVGGLFLASAHLLNWTMLRRLLRS